MKSFPRDHSFRLVCISEDHSEVSGGVAAVVDQLSRRVAETGPSVDLVYVRGKDRVSPAGVHAYCNKPTVIGMSWGWSPSLHSCLSDLSSRATRTVFHIHGIWTAPHYLGARFARKNRIPFVVSAHGMLEPWLWDRQGLKIKYKKKLYWQMMAYPALSAADVIHAITPIEEKHLKALFPKNRIEVIPNAIDISEYSTTSPGDPRPERVILFLGRIEPKKGVDILLSAFAKAKLHEDWQLVLIGPHWSSVYQKQLKKIVTSTGIGHRVFFAGPVFGEKKLEWLRKAWVLAAPSHSEAVGLVNLEASALLTPTITTHETGLFDWEIGGGLLIRPDVEQMRSALERACSWSMEERIGRGKASRKLVNDRYSWHAVLPKWISLYQSLVMGANNAVG